MHQRANHDKHDNEINPNKNLFVLSIFTYNVKNIESMKEESIVIYFASATGYRSDASGA
jgi:hypothetical protein